MPTPAPCGRAILYLGPESRSAEDNGDQLEERLARTGGVALANDANSQSHAVSIQQNTEIKAFIPRGECF